MSDLTRPEHATLACPDTLERELTRQYARQWRLLREHGVAAPEREQVNGAAYNLLLDVANLRRRDIERLRGEPTQ